MKILALELSTARGSLAWFDSATMAADLCEWPNDRKDSGRFFENLQLRTERFGPADRIVVGLGPGSYAGIRIAISAAIGLAAGGSTELLGYPSVCAINGAVNDYIVIGDARRRSFFFVRIASRTVPDVYELLNEDDLKARLRDLAAMIPVFSSDALPQFQPGVEQRYPSAEVLARLATDPKKKFFGPPIEPIYLRDANVTMPKPIAR